MIGHGAGGVLQVGGIPNCQKDGVWRGPQTLRLDFGSVLFKVFAAAKDFLCQILCPATAIGRFLSLEFTEPPRVVSYSNASKVIVCRLDYGLCRLKPVEGSVD